MPKPTIILLAMLVSCSPEPPPRAAREPAPPDPPRVTALCLAPAGHARVDSDGRDVWTVDCGGDSPIACELGAVCDGPACTCACERDGDCRTALLLTPGLADSVAGRCVDAACEWSSR